MFYSCFDYFSYGGLNETDRDTAVQSSGGNGSVGADMRHST